MGAQATILCISSLFAPSNSSQQHVTSPSLSYASRFLSSSLRSRLHPRIQTRCHSSGKYRVPVTAVLVEPEVQSVSMTSKDSSALLQQPETGLVNSRHVELVAVTEVDAAAATVSTAPASQATRLKGTSSLGLLDNDLESTLEHRLWVAFGGMAVAGAIVKALSACQSGGDVVQVAVGAVVGYALSDLVSGCIHWGVDNYGDAKTPIFGAQIVGFQGHHRRPWTITKRAFANNVHVMAKFSGFMLIPFLGLPSQPFFDSLLGIFVALGIMSQQFHAWAHMKRSRLPASILALQNAGILISGKMHGIHHKPPYDCNYCIVSGIWNPILKQGQVLKRVERLIYDKWGVAPRSWGETSEEWQQTDGYYADGTEMDIPQNS